MNGRGGGGRNEMIKRLKQKTLNEAKVVRIMQ